jgi:hypothetical protein
VVSRYRVGCGVTRYALPGRPRNLDLVFNLHLASSLFWLPTVPLYIRSGYKSLTTTFQVSTHNLPHNYKSNYSTICTHIRHMPQQIVISFLCLDVFHMVSSTCLIILSVIIIFKLCMLFVYLFFVNKTLNCRFFSIVSANWREDWTR